MARASVADRLLAAKLISAEHHAAAGYRQRTSSVAAEDFLVESGAIREEDLLKFLAATLGCQYLTTEKLRNASLPKALLDMVPAKVVEATGMMPIRWDARSRILMVLAADPENLDALGQLRAAAGVRDVQAVLARPAAIRATINRWYRNDPRAFQALAEDTRLTAADLGADDAGEVGDWLVTTAPGASVPPPQQHQWTIHEPPKEGAAPPGAAPPAAAAPAPGEAAPIAGTDYLETLNVLVSLIENARSELRGHSAVTARHARELGVRLGLSPTDLHSVMTAAYLHDLGKGSPFHLTALNVAEWEGHRDSARKRFDAPIRLFEEVALGTEAARAVVHMYERVDEQGFPTGLRGKEIPLGARILAIVDTYADLSQNARNPFRRTLGPNEAIAVFDRYRDKVFDGDLIDLFRLVVAGSDLRQRILAGFRPILVVDGDPEQSAALELRLLGRGFDVKVARTADAALRQLQDSDIHLAVSEVDLDPFDGFELLRRARATDRSKAIPFLFLTARAAEEDVARAFELGAADYVIKPSTTEVLVAKIRQTLERRAVAGPTAGVQGALSDMSLPDLVQILAQGRKTGKLTIRGDGRSGEIHFLDGRVANAVHGNLKGEEAFYAMLSITQGEFALDPEFKPAAVAIQNSAEALLLEGMRRIDEAGR
jgi:response regulator RpfG family c-di-GMP phosphodiesterase